MIVADGSVKLMTVEELKRDYRQLAGYRIFTEIMDSSRHCSASAFGACVMGMLTIPDKKRMREDLIRCGFYLDEGNLLLVCDRKDQMEEIISQILPASELEHTEMGTIFFEMMEYLIRDDMALLEEYENRLTQLEGTMTDDVQDIPEDFDGFISQQRKELRSLMSYYKLLNEVAHVMDEALFRAEKLGSRQLFTYLGNRISRLYSDAEGIAAYAMQIRDVYTSKVSMRQNQVMQTLTIVTAIFMPLTLLAGWYGMNFTTMPELSYPYGYLLTVLVAAAIVIFEVILFKRKKWF